MFPCYGSGVLRCLHYTEARTALQAQFCIATGKHLCAWKFDNRIGIPYSVGMHDWNHYIIEIESRLGLSLREVCRRLDCAPGTLCDIKKGRTQEPKATLGMAILRLYKQAMRRKVVQ